MKRNSPAGQARFAESAELFRERDPESSSVEFLLNQEWDWDFLQK
jgi:hypothetical protein